jgi:anthranilate phosphoribosyltransferase
MYLLFPIIGWCDMTTVLSLLPWFPPLLAELLAGRHLSATQMSQAMEAIMTGQCGEAEAAAFLVALRSKGETAAEIAAAARSLRQHMVRWDPGRPGVLDTCGTGGDGSGTFNISTAAALVAAACGVPVVKHGNRSASSRSGSADVLAALGLDVECDAAVARRCLDRAGLAFCFAPRFHPALRHVASVRRRLGVPTLFNLLGPLANPAGAEYQLLGVGRIDLLNRIAGALAELDSRRALVVCGADGLDEVSLSATTMVRQVVGSRVTAWEWRPEDFGLAPCTLGEVQAADAVASASIIRGVLAGADGPATRLVLANAAAALLAAERVQTPAEGVELARAAVVSGRAAHLLQEVIAATRSP